ncbi:MAG: O-antigen ligase family protein [Ignavibacteria bacterium]|nr:O-antigen ligase family protein [Ignavibacteria bacterium]
MKIALFLLFTSQFFSIFQMFALGTYPVTMFDVGVIAFMGVAIKRLLWDGEILEFPRTLATLCLFGIVITSLISAINPILEGNSVKQIQIMKTGSHFLYLVLLTILCSGLKIKITDWKFSIQAVLIFAIGVHLFGIYQLIARALDLPLAWISLNSVSFAARGGYDLSSINQGDVRQLSLNYGSFYRATSIFSEPSTLASFCMFILTALLVPFLRNTRNFIPSKKFNIILAVLTIISLFLTFSLTALSLFVGLLIFAFATERSKKSIKLLKMVAVTALIIISTNVIVEYATDISVSGLFTQRVSGIVSKYTGGRAETTEGESFFGRLSTIKYALEVWYCYPITGIGIGCYYYFNINEAHGFSDSGLFACLAETGILGFVMYIGILSGLFIQFKRFVFSPYYLNLSEDSKMLSHFSFYNILLVMIASFTSNTFVASYFWFEVGMFYSIQSIVFREMGNSVMRIQIMKVPLKVLFAHSQPIQK